MHISFGENCLIDNLLNRYGLKTKYSPFGAIKTNLEYNIAIINDNFKNFINNNHPFVEEIKPKRCVSKNYYYNHTKQHNIFCKNSSSGLEFSHHNLLTCTEHRQSYERKIKRFKNILFEEKNIIFLVSLPLVKK